MFVPSLLTRVELNGLSYSESAAERAMKNELRTGDVVEVTDDHRNSPTFIYLNVIVLTFCKITLSPCHLNILI